MSAFQKQFVRVEWLAFQQVVGLMREAGFDTTYFVGLSCLFREEGRAPLLARSGHELFDNEGRVVRREELRADDLGLAEIGEFAPCGEDSISYNGEYFLKRTYLFEIYRKGEGGSFVSAQVSFAKRAEGDDCDWELVHEGLVDQRLCGDARWVIYRNAEVRGTSNKD